MPSPQKTLVFDLDGTLVDSVRDLVPAINRTTALDDVPPVSLVEASPVVGLGAMKMIEFAYQHHQVPLSSERQIQLLPIFLKNYEAHIADHTMFYDGALEALNELENRGWVFAICTNKYERYARDILNKMGAISKFAAITGGDSFSFKKPDPAHLVETVRLAGGHPASAIMVGDTTNDILAAQAANIPSIAVDFGYADIPVAEMNPTEIISHFDELVKTVERIEG